MKDYFEQPWDIYKSSPFVDLDFSKLKNFSLNMAIDTFTSLKEGNSPSMATKTQKLK